MTYIVMTMHVKVYSSNTSIIIIQYMREEVHKKDTITVLFYRMLIITTSIH